MSELANSMMKSMTGGTLVLQSKLPRVNPNAVPNARIIENTYQWSNYKCQDGNRPFVKRPTTETINVSTSTGTHGIPLNPRLFEEYNQAVKETALRKQFGVNYNP